MWIQHALEDKNADLSVDQAVSAAKTFLKEMSVPWTRAEQMGTSTWSSEDLARHKAKMEIDMIRLLEEEARNGNGVVEVDEYGGDDLDEVMAGLDA
jgi:DNA excision repair protein ERCC-2